MRSIRTYLLAVIFAVVIAPGYTKSADELPLEVYGRQDAISEMAVSPNGDRIAFRRTDESVDAIFVVNRSSGDVIGVVDGSKTNLRRVKFLDQDRLILFAEESEHMRNAGARLKVSASFIYDLRSNELTQLLKGSRHIYPLQTGGGRIVGHDLESDAIFIPGFVGELNSTPPTFGLLEVTLDDPNGRLLTRGTSDTIDWFVDNHGQILAEEERDDQRGVRRIWGRKNDTRVLLYESDPTSGGYVVVGLSQDMNSLVVTGRARGSEYNSYFEMSLDDGTVGPPIFGKENTNILGPLVDTHRRVYGVTYTGFFPRYEFFDDELSQRVNAIQASMKTSALFLVDWTPDFSYLIFRATGGWTAGAYLIVGPDSLKPDLLANIREDIPREAVVPVSVTNYPAHDGLKIPALITALDDVRIAGKAPLIVMPHGGPESYDRYEFDWLAQYFASRGIVVLQPQFRGSTGFGASLHAAGRGQWGRDMSRDLDDGVQRLIEDGLVDPGRVCMVGLSYGGYAALAAAAFSPLDYKCVVSVSGVSDLPRMLDYQRKVFGDSSSVVQYSRSMLGSEGKPDSSLESISPVNFAKDFEAPVLLVHGRDDSIVSMEQSQRMDRALRRAKKSVEFVKLKGEDHYLSGYETRLEALQAIAKFIQENL